MTFNPEITILICTHNGSTTVGEVLYHISQQKNMNLELCEVLIVDNASSDRTSEIAAQKINELGLYGNIINEPRIGKTNAFLAGVKAARAPIVSIVDDDNFIEPDFLHYTLNIFKNYPKVLMVGSNNYIGIDEEVPPWFNCVKGRYACGRPSIEDVLTKTDDGVIIGNSGFISGAGSSFRLEPLRQCLKAGYQFFNYAQRNNGLTTIAAEDIELAFLFRSMGGEFAYDSRIKLRHAIDPKRLNLKYLEDYSKQIGAGLLGFEPFMFTSKFGKQKRSLKWTWQWQLISKLKRYISFSFFQLQNDHYSDEENSLRNRLLRLECQGAIVRILRERKNYTRHIRQVSAGEWTIFRVR